MSGYMIGVDIENGKLLYLANIADEQDACDAVMRATDESNARALTTVPAGAFQFMGIPVGSIQPYHPG